jgi:two-component system nitrate/nitrite response regulator NarL
MKSSSPEQIRIVIVNSHTLIRAGLRLLLESHPELKVVGEAGKTSEAVEIVLSLKPDIILLKLDPFSSIDLDIIQKLTRTSNCSRIILLARSDETQALVKAVQEGVLGVVLKTQAPNILFKAIQKVHAGEVWIERSMMANLITGLNNSQNYIALDPQVESIAQLSPRERQVIQQIGQGRKNSQIAEALCLSEATVRHHLTSIYNKLGVSDRLELLVFAHRHGLD